MAAIVLVVVLALVGVGTFVLMGGTMKAPPVTCAPITSPQCGVFVNLHDVSVLVPFKTASQGVPVGVTATVPQGETATSYTFDFGDGSPLVKSTNSIVSHTYTSA
ncbi:MAG TPA: PKD domain-containing protein, partial [Thermoplasmata archaeon]|nr:PKD domain-containing protein [Thermoplasmata archaeon]